MEVRVLKPEANLIENEPYHVWIDGPLAREIVEASTDTTVVIHPLTDDRGVLPIDKLSESLF